MVRLLAKEGNTRGHWSNFCSDPIFFHPIIFFPTKTSSITILTKLYMFWDLESGTWELELRIWNSDLGLSIENLGLGIYDLDSSWPTDPFDHLGVAQLYKIWVQLCCSFILEISMHVSNMTRSTRFFHLLPSQAIVYVLCSLYVISCGIFNKVLHIIY